MWVFDLGLLEMTEKLEVDEVYSDKRRMEGE